MWVGFLYTEVNDQFPHRLMSTSRKGILPSSSVTMVNCMFVLLHLLFHVTIPYLFKACVSLYCSVIQPTKAYVAETSGVIESMLRHALKSPFQLFLHMAMSLYDINSQQC